MSERTFNGTYAGAHLDRLAFPLGGIGAGMIALEGAGKLGQVSLRHAPAVFYEPFMYAAVAVRPEGSEQVTHARVVEGPVPGWKALFPWGEKHEDSGTGGRGRTYGLPRFGEAAFDASFPFATVSLADVEVPLRAEIVGWSPFVPGDSDASSLPVAGLEYRLTNTSDTSLALTFSFHSESFLHADERHGEPAHAPRPRRIDGGFCIDAPGFDDAPWAEGHFAVRADAPETAVDCAWFRGHWFDTPTRLWQQVQRGEAIEQPAHETGPPSNGTSLYCTARLAPGASHTVRLQLGWYMPQSNLRIGPSAAAGPTQPPVDDQAQRYTPWYAGRFAGIDQLMSWWEAQYEALRTRSARCRDALAASTLPPEAMEAVTANLGILKSPTVLRQKDGRLWAWEGCFDGAGCCPGSCTHVWNYAQALPHLFPDLERSLRETEFTVNQAGPDTTPDLPAKEHGHQAFRAALPICPPDHDRRAAADGQLGGIVKVYRDWRISGDLDWLRSLWTQVRDSLDYAIRTWDPEHEGAIVRPHHNTYDIEFHGPNGMITSFYHAALHAVVAMGEALNEDVAAWRLLLERSRRQLEEHLFNGDWFVQRVRRDWVDQAAARSPEEAALIEREGPKYQYGAGCLTDGVLGLWLAEVSGLTTTVDSAKVLRHLASVHRHNFRHDLSAHVNPQRPTYAFGDEGGLLLCSWPRGGEPSLPFVYANEVWTGCEYQVASHLIRLGRVEEGLEIVRAARRRYDGRVRNPFDEIECGHWYARAMASYALLYALTGVRYDAVTRTLHVAPRLAPPQRVFLSTATGFGVVHINVDEVRMETYEGDIPVDAIDYVPADTVAPAPERRG